MDLAARRTRSRRRLGLHRQRSADVVDLDHCLVLHPGAGRTDRPLAQTADAPSGIAPRRLGDRQPARQRPRCAAAHRCTAAACRPHRAHRIRPRALRCRASPGRRATTNRSRSRSCARRRHRSAGITITPPPGAFLQASASGEAAIVAAVLDALPAKGRIAELFAGCGTITFALARACPRRRMGRRCGFGIRARAPPPIKAGLVGPHRGDATRPGASAAAGEGTRRLCRGRAGSAVCRRRHPVDPDRRGESAGRHLRELQPRHAVARRTAAAQAGYRLKSATPIDQFLWSARLESVCVFTLASGLGREDSRALTADRCPTTRRPAPRDSATSGHAADAAVRCRAAG